MENSYVFEWFDQLISIKLNPQKEGSLSRLTPTELDACGLQAETEKETIRLLLMREVFDTGREKTIELLVEQYQASIIRLLNQLCTYETKAHPGASFLYKKLREVLEDLLQFIETYFAKYFNLDQEIPLGYWTVCKRDLQKDAKRVEALVSRLGEDAQLISIVTQYFSDLPPAISAAPWSYRKRAYHKAFFKELSEIHTYAPFAGEGFSPLTALLLYINFNNVAFIQHVIANLEKQLQSEEGADKKVAMLHRLFGTVQLMQVKPDTAFAPSLPSAQDFLLQWISFELNYKSENTISTMSALPENANEEKKVQLSVSVAMLGLFLRLLTEEDIITTKNQLDLIRFFAAHFATPKQSDISSDSLYGSYFKPQPGTIRMMKECLFRMQGTLSKRF